MNTPQVGDVWVFRGRVVVIDSLIGEAVYYKTDEGELKACSLRMWFSVPKLIERNGEKVNE